MKTLKATAIDHVNITVKNLKETVEFYKNIFGFEVKKDQKDQNSKIIGNNNIKLCIYEDSELSKEGGINHFGFHVENFDDIIEKCKENGVTVLYGGVVGWEKSESIYIEDPSGYVIELSRIRGGGI